MKTYEALEVDDDQGEPLGYWRLHAYDCDPESMRTLCDCTTHTTAEAARQCIAARVGIAAEVLAPEIELRVCRACAQLYDARAPHLCLVLPRKASQDALGREISDCP